MRDLLVGGVCQALRPFLATKPRSLPLNPSFLVIKPCCLGDVLFATAAVAALRQAFPQARIDFAVGAWSRVIAEHNPYLDAIVDAGPVGSGHYGLGDYFRLVRRLREGGYAAALVLDRSPLLALLLYLARIPVRAGLDSEGRGLGLTHPVPAQEGKHEAQLYLEVVQALGIETADARLTFLPTEAERARAAEVMDSLGPPAPLALIHPGGGENPGTTLPAKRWPPQRLAELADRLAGEDGLRVALVGGPRDEKLAQAIMEKARIRPVDLTGKLTFGELAALMERACLYLGHDTGATHLAVAMGTPAVALYGPTDPAQYGPFRADRAIALWHKLDCGPCFRRGRYDASCREPQCIQAINVEEVWEAAKRLLSTGNSESNSDQSNRP